MNYLAVAFPAASRLRLPVSRDQAVLLLVVVNLLLLGVETYFAHLISGTIVPRERIPIVFGPIGGLLLLLAGMLALRRRPLATVLASLVFVASIAVGLLGAYYHLVRALLPDAPFGQQISIPLLVWAPPVLGPFTFSLVGLIGLSAAVLEKPTDSGVLRLPWGKTLHLYYSKTRAYLFMVSLGSLATVVSSVLDHARTDFGNPWLWLATAAGIYATVVAAALAAIDHPTRSAVLPYVVGMLLMLLIGVAGSLLHIRHDLASQSVVVIERLIRGAPPLAPLLFSDMGLIGLVVLLDPSEPLHS